jgi:hypothetical protein
VRASAYSPASRNVRGASAAAAQADARARAQSDAAALCAPLDANERLIGVDVAPTAFDCRAGFEGGTVCALDYSAACHSQVQPLEERCG